MYHLAFDRQKKQDRQEKTILRPPLATHIQTEWQECSYQAAPQFVRVFPAWDSLKQGAHKASVLQAFYVAIYEIGCLGGAIFALMFGDKLGRRKMITIGAFVLIAGVVIQITAFSGSQPGVQFIIGRIITGLGRGFKTLTVPAWHTK